MRRPLALVITLHGPLLGLAAGCGDDKDPTLTADTAQTDGATGQPDPTSGGDETAGDPATGEPDSADSGDEDDPVWDTPYCYPVAGPMKWPEPLPTWESEVVELVNAARATGGDCDTMGKFPSSAPLTVNPHLHCSARVHSKDMADRDFFDHTNPDGEDPFDRMAKAGYGSYALQGENIAAGTMTAKATVDGWLASDGHCANMLNPQYKEIGVGAYEGAGEYVFYWTQNFGTKN